MRLAAALMLATWSLAAVAHAAEDGHARQLQSLEEELARDRARAEALAEQARALAAEVEAVKRELVRAARKAQRREAELTQVEERLSALEQEAAAKRQALTAQRGRLRQTLAALQRIALLPPEALLAASGEPVDLVRSAMLLSVAVPGIEERAAGLRDELAELHRLAREIAGQRERLAAAGEALAQQRRHLRGLLAEKRALHEATAAASAEAAARAVRLAAEAADMRDLVERLRRQAEERERARRERARQAAQAAAPTPEAKPSQQVALAKPGDIRAFPQKSAGLRMPAAGRLVRHYGERVEDAGGPRTAKGITIATRPQAQVVAPYDGQVVYAGPFRGYGRILIIEHGGGYHTLLAGLGRIDAVVGQWVLTGEPVGIVDEAGDRNPKLYVELRREGEPINPQPWLAATDDKVRG